MWSSLRHPGFLRLFLAQLVSQAGTQVHRIALLTLVYLLTKAALWVSLILITQFVARILVGPLLAAWSDTQDRRRVMIVADLGRAVVVPLIPVLGNHSLPGLLVLVFLVETLTALFDPAANASVPDLVPPEHLDESNGLMEFTQRFAEVAFLGGAGVLVGMVGTAFAFYFDALTYLVSAMLLLGLPRLGSVATGSSGYWSRAREGIQFLWLNRAVRTTVGLLFTAACFGSVEGVLMVIFANKVLGVGAAGFGLIEAAMALGVVLMTLSIGGLSRQIARERLFLLGLGAFGLFEASIGALPMFVWTLIAVFFSGVFNTLFIVPARSILQNSAPPEIRGRLFAAFRAVMAAAQIIGAALAGLAEPYLGASLVFILAGLLVSAFVGVVSLRGGIPVARAV